MAGIWVEKVRGFTWTHIQRSRFSAKDPYDDGWNVYVDQ